MAEVLLVRQVRIINHRGAEAQGKRKRAGTVVARKFFSPAFMQVLRNVAKSPKTGGFLSKNGDFLVRQ
jgi:hypothetical protein